MYEIQRISYIPLRRGVKPEAIVRKMQEVSAPLRGFPGLVDLQVDGGPGHRDYLTLPLQKGRVNLDEVVINPGSGQGLNLALAPALVGMVGVMVRVRSRRQQR